MYSQGRTNLFLKSAILFLLILAVAPSTAYTQDGVGDVRISRVDVESFPEVTIDLQIVDGVNVPVANVANGDLLLRENGADIATELHTLRELSDGNGVRIHFVIDVGLKVTNSGSGENLLLNTMREPIVNFVNDVMIENQDEVSVTAVERTGANPVVLDSMDGSAVLAAVEGYNPPSQVVFPTVGPGTPQAVPAGSYSDPFTALDNIVADMDSAAVNLAKPQVIVFLSPELETTLGNADVAEAARNAGIPIYTIMTNQAIDQAIFQSVANTSRGRFVDYVSRPQDLTRMFEEIASRRILYQLSYRSTANQSGTQQVEVVYSPAGGTLSDIASFDIEVSPPRVIIETPTAGEQILRETDSYTDDPTSVLPTNYTVVATIVFPDEHERNLITGELRVNGATVGSVRNPETRIQFPWDISGFSTTEVTLEVEVQDELGLSASNAPIIVGIDLVIPPEPTPLPPGIDASDIITIVQEIVPEATDIPCLTPGEICSRIERPIRSNITSFISLSIAVLSLIFAMFVWFNRGKVVAAGGRVGGAVTSFVERVTGRRVQATPKAYLVVVEGDQNVGRTLEVYGDTPMGRSKQFAELLFQQNDDNSPISRLHATIIDEEIHFTLRDEDSANGTFLNGVRLTPLQDEELHDGDEIELAQVERGGVKLLFQMAEKRSSGVPDSARVTNPSLNVGRFEDTLATDFDDDEDDF